MFVRKILFTVLSALTLAACGGSPTSGGDNERKDTSIDTGTDVLVDVGVDSSADTSYNDSGSKTVSRKKVKKQVCNECKTRDQTCPNGMGNQMKEEYENPDIQALADKFCQDPCPNPEADEGEPCDDPCAQEREVKCYAWDCPHSIYKDDDTYSVNVKGDKCMMKNEHGWGPWSEGRLAWRYDGGNKLKIYSAATEKWITCTGTKIKTTGPVCGN